VYSEDKTQQMIASFRFSGDFPPGIAPEHCVANLADLCSGILLFDILIANDDRHDGNLASDSRSNPKNMMVFDHDNALFGSKRNDGVARLNRLENRLGISGGTVPQGNRHCLLDVIDTARFFRKWIHRISCIPDWLIEEICKEARGTGIGAAEANAAEGFLKRRRNTLDGIVRNHRGEFRAVKAQEWGLT
jgi:hypothetical protein